ncbi:MAG: flagellar basal body-associated FliL family protein [Rhodoferax sp.]|nr:flagellar basal body-associated FliL family protein [Rhodoferax sp.]
MADKPADAAPPKSKKLLLIVGVLVVVLALAGGGAFFFISKQRAAAADEGEHEAVVHAEAGGPPTYLPLDNMVVNLADPGGEKVAQIGITLELIDAKSVEKVKQYLPTIRSSVLLLVSQRTAEELLQREGKEKLAKDILREAARPFGGGDDEDEAEAEAPAAGAKKPKTTKRPKPRVQMPVTGVLFSSFIVQ